MSNKQSSVEWLFHKLWDTPKDKLNWYAIAEQAKAMHKEEIIETFGIGAHYKSTILIGYHSMAETYYNEMYGGNNEL